MNADHSAALAGNWRTVLAVDASLGLGGLLAGLAAMVWLNLLVGGLIVAAGGTYVVLVVRRGIDWRAQRRAAGLS